jgi:hypothetical protein
MFHSVPYNILDNELVAEVLGKLLRDEPPDRIILPARSKWHNQAHWP